MKKKPRDFVSDDTKKLATNINIRFHEEEDFYSKKRFALIHKGYDFLEDLFVVRTYIIRKYKIQPYLFQILLKLMGMRIFSINELLAIPKNFKYNKLRNLLDTGYINIVVDDKKAEKRLYCLNTQGKNVVKEFYQYLSGEKQMPLDHRNPMTNANTKIPYDVKKVEVIKKLNALPIKEHNKVLFEN